MDNPTEIVRADVDGAVQALQGNDAEFYEKFMEGEDKFGTAPLRDSYLALCHTDMIGQLENVAGFINKAQYPNPNGSKNMAEWGSVGNTRWFVSSRGSITANASLAGADIYNCFIVAQEAYSCVELDGGTVSLFYHPAGLTKIKTEILLKSSLMDSKTLPGNAEDNEAQATERCAA